MTPVPSVSVFRSPLTPIFLVVAVDIFGLTLMIPLLPFYAQHFGASPMTVGLLLASYAACQLVSGPVLGRISDTVGRRPTLIASQIGTLIGFLVLGFANSLWLIFLGRIIDGLTAGNITVAQAYITDVTRPEERTRAYGLIGIAFGMGFLIGPALSGFLSQYGYQWPAFAAAGLSFLSILSSTFLLPSLTPVAQVHHEHLGRLRQFTVYFERPQTRRRLLQFFAYILAFSMQMGGLALFLDRQLDFDATHTGYLFGFLGLIGVIVQGGLIGRLVQALGEVRLSILGFTTMGIALMLLGTVHSLPWLLVVMAVLGFGTSVTRPSLTTLLTRSVGPGEQGAALGVSQSLSSVAAIFGPMIAGWLINRELLLWFGIVAGIFALVGMAMMLRDQES